MGLIHSCFPVLDIVFCRRPVCLCQRDILRRSGSILSGTEAHRRRSVVTTRSLRGFWKVQPSRYIFRDYDPPPRDEDKMAWKKSRPAKWWMSLWKAVKYVLCIQILDGLALGSLAILIFILDFNFVDLRWSSLCLQVYGIKCLLFGQLSWLWDTYNCCSSLCAYPLVSQSERNVQSRKSRCTPPNNCYPQGDSPFELTSLPFFILLSFLHGPVDLLQRLTIFFRDYLWYFIYKKLKRDVTVLSAKKFRTPRSMRIQMTLRESSALSGWIHSAVLLYVQQHYSFDEMTQFFIKVSVALGTADGCRYPIWTLPLLVSGCKDSGSTFLLVLFWPLSQCATLRLIYSQL